MVFICACEEERESDKARREIWQIQITKTMWPTINLILSHKVNYISKGCPAQPAKLDLNKKSFPKQKTIQNFTIVMSKGSEKQKMKIVPHGK